MLNNTCSSSSTRQNLSKDCFVVFVYHVPLTRRAVLKDNAIFQEDYLHLVTEKVYLLMKNLVDLYPELPQKLFEEDSDEE